MKLLPACPFRLLTPVGDRAGVVPFAQRHFMLEAVHSVHRVVPVLEPTNEAHALPSLLFEDLD